MSSTSTFEAPLRIAYLDEAGISNPAEEPYLVVSGVIMNPDEQWRPIEEHFRTLAKRYLPDDSRPIFHAKDIWHGSGKFDRKEWPRERRWHLLSELCEIPRKFDLPIVVGYRHRQRHRENILKLYPQASSAEIHNMTHADAFINAAMAIETWMRRVTRNESTMIIAEDTPRIKNALQLLHSGYTDRYAEIGSKAKFFHSDHIVESVYFASKRQSMPLQIADACAFIIKRHLMDKPDVSSFFGVMRLQIYWHDDENGGVYRELAD